MFDKMIYERRLIQNVFQDMIEIIKCLNQGTVDARLNLISTRLCDIPISIYWVPSHAFLNVTQKATDQSNIRRLYRPFTIYLIKSVRPFTRGFMYYFQSVVLVYWSIHSRVAPLATRLPYPLHRPVPLMLSPWHHCNDVIMGAMAS